MEGTSLLIESLKDVASLLNESKIKFCLAGGLAVGILSVPRATEDIENSFKIEIDQIQLPVISKRDLINMKSSSSRLKDQADIEALTSEP